MRRLQQHWKAIVAGFFPRWRAASRWRCTTQTRRTAHGHCDLERHVVEIGIVSQDDDALDLLLIHEIAHAVASAVDTEIVNYRERGEPLAVAYGSAGDAMVNNLKLDDAAEGVQAFLTKRPPTWRNR